MKELLKEAYSKREITFFKLYDLISDLELFEDRDPHFCYSNIGKLLTAFGDKNDAIRNLEKAIKVKDDCRTDYYNLYKCNVVLGNYKEAFDNLYKCAALSPEKANFSLPLLGLSILNYTGEDFNYDTEMDYQLEYSDSFCFNTIYERSINDYYHEVIKLFNEHRFQEAQELLGNMQEKIVEIDFPMEVDTLRHIVTAIVEKEKDMYETVLRDNTCSFTPDEYAHAFEYVFNNKYISEKDVLKAIEDFIINDELKIALKLMQTFFQDPRFSDYKTEKSYLRGYYSEQKAYLELPEDVTQEYSVYLDKAKALYHKGDYKGAEVYFRKAKEVSGLKICDYYIGKTLFKQHKNGQAKEHLLAYFVTGGSKYDKCLLFLNAINNFVKKKDNKKYVTMMLRIHSTFDRDYDYYKKDHKSYNAGVQDSDIADASFFNANNTVTNCGSGEVETLDFYDCDVSGKLNIIKGLFINGNNTLGNFLLREIEKGCNPEDMGKVRQFQKNKKLYANQNRTN